MDVNNETYALNLDKICRACLAEQEEEQMKSIFSEIDYTEAIEEEASFLYEILMNVSSIRILEDDRMPTSICTHCYSQAMIAYKFKVQCDRSNLILQGCLDQAKLDETINSDMLTDTDLELERIDIAEATETDGSTEIKNVYVVTTPEYVTTAEVLDEDVLLDVPSEDEIKEETSDDIDDPAVCDGLDDDDDVDAVVLDVGSIATSDENRIIKQRLALKRMQNVINCKVINCQIQEVQRNSYFTSMAKTLENGERIYQCSVCQKEYKHATTLKVHFKTHTSDRPFLCKLCGKGFKQWTSLSYHTRTHSDEQPYACKLCDKRYKQPSSLTAHMRIHTGQRPYLCSVCGKGFRQAPDLGYHMRTHTKEKPYMCTVCGKRMAMQCHLVQHMRTHTGEKPFTCKVCDKGFASTTRLKRHEIIHTGLKPYKCDVCEKSFNRSSTLRVHAMIHSDTRPHTCPICNKGFIQAHCLRSHLNTHK